MRRIAGLLLVLFSSFSLFADDEQRKWNDTLRDVYVDGVLDRSIQTLVTSEPRMMALLPAEGDAIVLEPAAKEAFYAPRAEFALAADHLTATTKPQPDRRRAGTVASPDSSTYLATIDGKSILVAAHQSQSGPMSEAELWQTAPVWRTLMEQYEPDAAAVARLKAVEQPVTLKVVLATWCPDSRRYVPRLLKAVQAANNPNVKVELVGIGPDFLSPMDFIRDANIINVPMVIAYRGEREVGRYTETPAAPTIEEDVVDLITTGAKAHPGRWERRAKLGEGVYALRDARGRAAGLERFEIYDTKDDGRLVHSVVELVGGERIETWASADAHRIPTFAEVTHRRADGHVTRARHRRGKGTWTAVARGDRCGIVEQTVAAPDGVGLVSPATAAMAWGASDTAYVIRDTLGSIQPARGWVIARGEEVPRRVRFEDGTERRLIRYAAAK